MKIVELKLNNLLNYNPWLTPLSSPTYNSGYQLMPKFANIQIYKINNSTINNYK